MVAISGTPLDASDRDKARAERPRAWMQSLVPSALGRIADHWTLLVSFELERSVSQAN
ncbi:hypothetical protein [Nitrobacter sp.]|uniref:hypothetical protein n=1 Tax=unclassified Nitrobacter TaxID=2620411 RepID=UPI0032203E47